MQRRVMLAALAAATLAAGCATRVDMPPLQVVTVHEAPGKSKADVCRTARDWAALTFRDSKAVVEVYDLEAGTLIGKGATAVVFPMDGSTYPVTFTMQVECRDGRARSTFDSFFVNYPSRVISGVLYPATTVPLFEDTIGKYQTQADEKVRALAKSLDAKLREKSTAF